MDCNWWVNKYWSPHRLYSHQIKNLCSEKCQTCSSHRYTLDLCAALIYCSAEQDKRPRVSVCDRDLSHAPKLSKSPGEITAAYWQTSWLTQFLINSKLRGKPEGHSGELEGSMAACPYIDGLVDACKSWSPVRALVLPLPPRPQSVSHLGGGRGAALPAHSWGLWKIIAAVYEREGPRRNTSSRTRTNFFFCQS